MTGQTAVVAHHVAGSGVSGVCDRYLKGTQQLHRPHHEKRILSREHSPVTRLSDRNDDVTIIDEPVPF